MKERFFQKINNSNILDDEIIIYKNLVVMQEDLNSMTNLELWKKHKNKFPILTTIAKKYLSIPAGSIADESLFSQTSEIDSINRNRLSETNLQNNTFIKNNIYFFE